jgi:hypothetical protein
MNPLLSNSAVRVIEEFANRWGCGALRYYPAKIVVSMGHVNLVFFQSERYSRALCCYFDFGGDVLFFYEDARAAIENRGCLDQYAISELSKQDELQANDNFVEDVIRFCLAHEEKIAKLPPPWFPAATLISDKRTRKNFPEIADADLQRKQLFWENLNKSSGS